VPVPCLLAPADDLVPGQSYDDPRPKAPSTGQSFLWAIVSAPKAPESFPCQVLLGGSGYAQQDRHFAPPQRRLGKAIDSLPIHEA